MSNPSQSGEIEKFGIIPARLDDVKKTYKTLKSSLAESLGAFNNYGKSLIKASRPLHFAFNHSDPSFICKLTLNLLTQQAQTSKLLNHSVSEALKDFSKDMDTYEEKLDQTRAKTFDKISESLRSLGVARAAYVKERGNYEKVCKEAEAAVAERKKPITDPILYYNLTHQRKLKAKVIEGLQNLTTSEQQARDALETYSMRQQVLNVGLSESLRVFKETLRTVLESIFSNVKKHNQVVQGFLQKELNHYEKADLLTSAGTFSFPSDSDEQEFIQKVALESQEPQVKDPAQAKEPKEPKHKFLDIHYKLLEKPQSLSDQEVYEYAELAQKHYEASLQVFEERQKAIKGLKAYMLELALVCTATEKTFQKISKNSLSQVTGTTLSKQLGSNIDALYEGLAAFGSLFQQLAGYLNSKAPLLDGLTNDYRDYIKVFQAGFTKALKDSVGSRSAVATLVGQQDKLNKKVTDVNERDPDDERLPVMIEEQENVKKQLGELLAEMRRQTIDTASGINKAFDDYRIQEQMKFMDFQNIIKGHLEQEHKLAKGLMDALKTMETGLEANISAPVEEKAEKALKEDKLNGYLQYYEMNMQENQNNASTKQTLEFKKLYVPPENVLNDEEGADKVDVVEEEDEAAAAGKEQEKVDEGDKISAEKLRTRFGLKPNEKLVENFACGVEQRIIRQGRMYIYNTAVCFSTVKLLGDIAISIPFEDILRIEKKTMSLVFDTALSVITKNGEIKFLSFFYRDKAFNLLVSLVKENNSTFVSPEKVERKDSSAATPKVDSDGGSAEQAKNKRMQEVITERLKRAAAEAEAEASNSGSEAEEKEPGSGMRRASLDLSDGEGEKQDKDKQQEDKGEKKAKEGKEENKVKESEDNKDKESKVVKETNTPTTVEPKSAGKPSTEQKEKEKENVKVEQPAEEAKKPVEAEVVEKKVEKKEPEGPSQEELDKKEKHKLMKVIEQKKVKLSAVVVSEDTCPQLMTQETFDCSALDLFMGAFSDRKVTYKGKSFDCFWTLAKTEGGDTDIKYNRWTPDPPFEGVYEDKDSLECLRKFAEGTGQTTRSLTYIHPVDGGPFVPKTCQVEEKHTGYWLSPTEFVMQMLVQTSKVPMSDCFFARNYFRVKELPGQKCEFTWKLGLEFVKSTMFKGKITSATQSENLSYAKKVFVPLLKENMAVWMKEKAQVLKKREAKKAAKREAEKEFDRQAKEQRQAAEAKQEEVKKAEEKAAVSEVKKEEGAGQGEEKVVVEKEGEKEEKKVEDQTEMKSGETDDSKSEVESAKDDEDLDKKVKVSSGLKDIIKESIKESIGEDLGKFIREAERSREESRDEVKMLRNLVFALLAINSFLILYLVMRG